MILKSLYLHQVEKVSHIHLKKSLNILKMSLNQNILKHLIVVQEDLDLENQKHLVLEGLEDQRLLILDLENLELRALEVLTLQNVLKRIKILGQMTDHMIADQNLIQTAQCL